MQAGNVDALRQCGIVIIMKLFTRRDDGDERMRYGKLLQSVIENDEMAPDLDAKKQFVAKLLRGIKTVRQEEAATYLERKRRGAALERRTRRRIIEKRIQRAVYAGLGLALAVGIYFFASWILDLVRDEMRTKGPIVIQGKLEEDKEDELKLEDPAKGVDGPVNVIILNPVRWTFAPDGKKKRTIYYSPVLSLTDPSLFPGICRYGPSLLDTIYAAMSRNLPNDSNPDTRALTLAGVRAGLAINRSLEMDVVRGIDLRTDISDRLKQNNRQPCRPFRE